MSNPQPFRWEQIDHALVGTRTTAIRTELFALLAKGPSLEEEGRIAELADKLYSVYCEVWELQGFRKNAMFIGIVHGKIAAQIRARVSSVKSGLQREDRRRGGLTSSHGKRTSLDLTGKRVASILQGRAKARVRELGYIERATTSIPSLARHQPPDLPGLNEKKFGSGIQPPDVADVLNRSHLTSSFADDAPSIVVNPAPELYQRTRVRSPSYKSRWWKSWSTRILTLLDMRY